MHDVAVVATRDIDDTTSYRLRHPGPAVYIDGW